MAGDRRDDDLRDLVLDLENSRRSAGCNARPRSSGRDGIDQLNGDPDPMSGLAPSDPATDSAPELARGVLRRDAPPAIEEGGCPGNHEQIVESRQVVVMSLGQASASQLSFSS